MSEERKDARRVVEVAIPAPLREGVGRALRESFCVAPSPSASDFDALLSRIR